MSSLAGKIQDAELEVMRELWRRRGPTPLIEIRRQLAERCGWEDSTVKTLLRRLCAKDVVRLESRGMYRALVSEGEYNRWSTANYVKKMFDGSAKKLVAALVDDGQLSEGDIAELSAMFNGGGDCD